MSRAIVIAALTLLFAGTSRAGGLEGGGSNGYPGIFGAHIGWLEPFNLPIRVQGAIWGWPTIAGGIDASIRWVPLANDSWVLDVGPLVGGFQSVDASPQSTALDFDIDEDYTVLGSVIGVQYSLFFAELRLLFPLDKDKSRTVIPAGQVGVRFGSF